MVVNLLSATLVYAWERQLADSYRPNGIEDLPCVHAGAVIIALGEMICREALDQKADESSEENSATLAISGPFGAVKEQSSGFYANIITERRLK